MVTRWKFKQKTPLIYSNIKLINFDRIQLIKLISIQIQSLSIHDAP
jgi:hypothetical protein